jgi:anti-sigma factor RsiW
MSASTTERGTAGPVCTIVRSSFGDYLKDALPSPQRRMLRDHLAGCDACRAEAEARDASFRFARTLSDAVSEAESQEILAAVRTGVDLMRAERRIRPARRARPLRMGSAAAAAVAAAILVSSGWGILRSPSALPASAAAPERRQSPVPASAADAAALQPAGLSAAAAAADATPPASPDATVYDWNPGAGREEPRVVWIVDRGLDI